MANAILNVGQTGGQVNISTAAAPATPAAGVVTLYAGTDKALHALNSDGVDITIAAAGASSPIEVVYGDTLVSSAIGATAGTAGFGAIVIGATATNGNSKRGHVIIGDRAIVCSNSGNGPDNVVIGTLARSENNADGGQGNNVAIGACAIAFYDGGSVAIGARSCARSSFGYLTSRVSTAVGFCAVAQDSGSTAIGAMSTSLDGAALGNGARGCGSGSTAVGKNTLIASTATTATAIGNSATVCGNACNAIAIGTSVVAVKISDIVIGSTITVPATSAQCSVYIGNCITPGGNCAGATNLGQVMVGFRISQNRINENVGGSVLIGHQITNNHQAGTGSDLDVMVGGCLTTACSRGNNTIVGRLNTGGGSANTLIGYNNTYTATDSLSHQANVLIGFNNCLAANICSANVIGVGSCATANCAQVFGRLSCSTHVDATVIGTGLSSERTNTTHVNSLIAYGQAASKTNAIGSTGGTVTINWDNSNIQTLTLDSDISTLTKSNPIDGAVYTLFLTQGGTGGKTVAWGADVEWPGGTPPTLSPTAGAVDAVSLVYIAGITGYYGNANLNFS
jgi:hypothetical protein